MFFYYIRLNIIHKNIFLSLIDFNYNIIFFRSIKWYLKYKKIKKSNLNRYSFKILNSFFLFFFDLIKKYHNKNNFYYILLIDDVKNFYRRFFINFVSFHYNFLKIKIFKILFLHKKTHGFMRKRKFRRL